MRSLFKKVLRPLLVIIGIILLTSVSIDATDTFRGSQSALSIVAKRLTEVSCPAGMVEVMGLEYRYCIDEYEASVGGECAVVTPTSLVDTSTNSNQSTCSPVSEPAALPWRFVTQLQATQLCARAGKELPNANEWYQSALGTPDNSTECALQSALQTTGAQSLCRAGSGAYDMVGNVWEYIDESVIDGVYDGVTLPEAGYVAGILPDGIAQVTGDQSNPAYNSDYFWTAASGTFAIMRGGFYGSNADGGLYSTHAASKQDFASAAIGFRCGKRL